MLSKAAYEKLADTLYRTRPEKFPEYIGDVRLSQDIKSACVQWVYDVGEISLFLREDNPRFDQGKFMARAGAWATSKGFRGRGWVIGSK